MGEVVQLRARPAVDPGPAVRKAIADSLLIIPPEDRGLACLRFVQQGLQGVAAVLGYAEAAAVARRLADDLAGASDAG